MTRPFNFYYLISADMHLQRAIECFDNAFEIPNGSYLFYAALEFRFCIERFLFEYIVLTTPDRDQIEKIKNDYRAKTLAKAIYEFEPEFDKKIEFLNFYAKAIGFPISVKSPDVNYLNSLYGKLGNYLHNVKEPAETTSNQDWWDTLIQLLLQTRSYLLKFFNEPRAFHKLNEEGLRLYEMYKNNSISKNKLAKLINTEFQKSLKMNNNQSITK